MTTPFIRPRRLRVSAGVRTLVRETELSAADFVFPLFVVPGTGIQQGMALLPGISQRSLRGRHSCCYCLWFAGV